MADRPGRSERFGVALRLVTAGEDALLRGAVPLTDADVAAAHAVDDDDLALVAACLEVEAQLRAQAFAALERLRGLLPPGGTGTLADRVRALPQEDFLAAASALYQAGLAYGTPDSSEPAF